MEAETNQKWEQLKAARRQSGVPASDTPPPADSPEAIADAKAKAQARDAAGRFTKDEVPPAEVAPPSDAPPPAAEAPPVSAAPSSEEIEIDGQKISIDPSLAEAFKRAEGIKKDAGAAAEREAMRAEIVEQVKRELKPEQDAKAIADEALAAAEKAAAESKMPDSSLMISDPDEYTKQLEVHLKARDKHIQEQTRSTLLTEVKTRDDKARKDAETRAAEVLREQFYSAYPVLKDSRDVTDAVLAAKFDEVVASGRLNKPLTVQEAEEIKKVEFADVAAKATRKIVAVMNAGKKIAPPPAPPPTLVSSAPAKAPAPPKAEDATPREKYPKGSVSALLAARKSSREQPIA